MADRQKYEQWLADLDAKKDSTPPHVFERVKGDYSARLQEVLGSLKQHTTDMQEHARGLMVRLKELEVSEEELRDEQAENELRAKVGEMTEAEFEASKKKADRLLAKFEEDREQVATDLNQIRQMLSGAPEPPQAEVPRHSTDFDELEFLKSVVGPTTPASSTPPAAPKARPSTEIKAAVPPVAPPPATAPKPAAPAPGPKQTPSDAPSAIRTSGVVEQPKTLKCAECGAMNYASEWYCERCGAELTVV